MLEFSLLKVVDLNLYDAQNYIKEYFVPLCEGNHAVFLNGKYRIMDNAIVKATYFKRMSKEINEWYFGKYADLRNIVYKLNKPVFYENKINLCPPLKNEYKKYETFDENTKKNVNIMLNYIFEILANKNKESNQFLLSWLAYMVQGNKNNSCLYLKGPQGVGKSTLFSFIRDYVIGRNLSCETGSEPIKSRFNEILAGKLMICFEELESFSTNEWIAISSRLKRYITSNVINIEGKGADSYETENMNNYIILSNNDAIKDDDGRRYFILDIATHKAGDVRFWDNIYNNCFTDEVGHAFYCYLCEMDTTKYNPQSFPITSNKLDAFAMRLDNVAQFLKFSYIQLDKSINCSVDELFKQYENFCEQKLSKSLGKIKFCKNLKDIGIEYFKSNDCNKFKVSIQKLNEIAEKKHWIHELDNITVNNKSCNETDDIDLLKMDNDKLRKYIIELENKIKSNIEIQINSNVENEIKSNVEINISKIEEQIIIPPKRKIVFKKVRTLEKKMNSTDEFNLNNILN